MDNRTIRVQGSAKVSKAPDWVSISFAINSKSADYEKCMKQLAKQTENLRKELDSIGLVKESLKTSRFTINTDFERTRDKNIFKGYVASHNLRVEFPFEKDYLNKVFSVLSHTKSKALFRVSFEIKDPEPLKQQAIAEAVKNSKVNAQVLAEAAGVTLGEIIQIDYSWSKIRFQSSLEVCETDAPISDPGYDFTPEDVDVSDSVTVIYSINA